MVSKVYLRTERPVEHRRGFTILELMIVVTIIGALMAIVFVAGRAVLAGGKASQTASVIQTLDTALNNAISQQGKIPAATVIASGNDRRPVSDVQKDSTVVDSTAWLLKQLELEGQDAGTLVRGLDPKFQRIVSESSDTLSETQTGKVTRQILDGWGKPIRYVHPQLDGTFENTTLENLLGPAPQNTAYVTGQFKREKTGNTTDGGTCVNNRPYFYSAGADGDYSTVDDNVYTSKPTFAPVP